MICYLLYVQYILCKYNTVQYSTVSLGVLTVPYYTVPYICTVLYYGYKLCLTRLIVCLLRRSSDSSTTSASSCLERLVRCALLCLVLPWGTVQYSMYISLPR